MSSLAILEDEEVDHESKTIKHAYPPHASRLVPVRTHSSTFSQALDAEANISHSPPPEQVNIANPNEKINDDDPGPPPNGGFYAWLQVLGSFFLFFNCW